MRILYVAGAGDVAGTHRHWRCGRTDPSQVAVTYSAQFFTLCRRLEAEALVLSTCPRRADVIDGTIRIRQRAPRTAHPAGAWFHAARIARGLAIVVTAVRFRADAVVVCPGAQWFVLSLCRMFGIAVIPSLHGLLWQKLRAPRGVSRVMHRLNRRFFARDAFAVLALSHDIARQVSRLTGGDHRPIVPFLPQYARGTFSDRPADHAARPFRVLFAGRVERGKGVFGLLDLARRFARTGGEDIVIDVCGDGRARAALEQQALALGLQSRLRCHGHCDQSRLRTMFERCQVVVVPTSAACPEGFNKVVIEGILAGRPVVTSTVCPALEYVREGVVEVPPDDVQAYGEAVIRLRDDRALYESKCAGCRAVGHAFHDEGRSWGAALARVLAALAGGGEMEPAAAIEPRAAQDELVTG